MFINLTNHPTDRWEAAQLRAASTYGTLTDLPFPQVPPESDEDTIATLADEYTQRVLHLQHSTHEPVVVHIAGEHTLVYALVGRLRQAGIRCIASTTCRIAEEEANGLKHSQFRFVRFREYR